MGYTSIFKTETKKKPTSSGYVSIFKPEPSKERDLISGMVASGQVTNKPIGTLPQRQEPVKYPELDNVTLKDVGREAFNIIASPFKKIAEEYKERRDKTPEEKAKEQALRNVYGLEGKKAQEAESKKIKENKSSVTYQDLDAFSKSQEQKTEKTAQAVTIPARWTAGELAKAITSVSLEKVDSDLKFDPRTDTEKLLVGEGRIQRLTEQEDLYGMIARGVGIPAALIAMTVIENPFLKETGVGSIIKNNLKKRVSKEAEQMVVKMGAEELAKIADDAIQIQQATGRITKEQAAKATEEVAKMKAPKIEKPITKADKFVKKEEEKRALSQMKDKVIHLTDSNQYVDIPKNMTNAQKVKLFNEVANISSDSKVVHISDKKVGKVAEKINLADAVDYSPDLKKTLDDIGYKIQKPKTPPIRTIPLEKVDLRKKITTEPLIAEPKVSKRISDQTIEKGLVDNFGDIPDRDIIKFSDQAKKVGKIIDEDPEKAIRIALGKELPTNGALPESVFIAVKNQAIKNGDTNLLRQLATEPGGVASEASTLGARIKMLDEGMKDDAFKRINKLVKDRKVKFEVKGKKVKESIKKETKAIKEKIVKPDKYDWDAFVNSIKC